MSDARKVFTKKMISVYKAYEKQPDSDAIDLYWGLLQHVSIHMLLGAIDAHMRDTTAGTYFPRPADILRQLPADPKTTHLTSDEAWSLAIVAAEEKNTVVWSVPMQGAWFIASPIYDSGDKVGARMAFKGAYERLVTEAKARGEPVRWVVSLGWDLSQRDSVITQALQLGRIEPSQVHAYLPAPVADSPVRKVAAIAARQMGASHD